MSPETEYAALEQLATALGIASSWIFARVVQVVTGQDGRRFWGVRTLSSPGQKTSEPFIGFLSGKGNQKVVMVDTDGYFNGELTDNDTVELCYAHTGGKTGSVASCFELKRSR